VEVPLLLQFSIALFTGMVAATFVPPVRRAIPRPVELGLWIGLIVVCTLAIIGIADPSARELTSSAVWGVDQIVNTSIGLLMGGVLGLISDNRFTIATWLAVLAGVDLLALALMRSMRTAQGWKPRVRLGEWMEVPPHVILDAEPVVAVDSIANLNPRLAAAAAVAGAQVLSGLVGFTIWMRNVVFPRETQRLAHAAAVGRVASRACLDSLRDATLHLQFAARAWYAAAGEPAVNDFGMKAAEAVRLTQGQVIDIQALMNAQSIGWYGPMTAQASLPPHGEPDGAESEQRDRLAS